MKCDNIILSNEMEFVDESLSDDIIFAIEYLVNYHIDSNYELVRNIIFGYDPKDSKWRNIYGKRLKEDNIFLSQEFYKDNKHKNKDNYGHYKMGLSSKNKLSEDMIFYDGDVFVNARIYMDKTVKRISDVLFLVSENVIDYKYIIDIAVNEWINKNLKENIKPTNSNDMYVDRLSQFCRWIYLRESSWIELKRVSKIRGLVARDAFKQALLMFLEDRANMIKNIENTHIQVLKQT